MIKRIITFLISASMLLSCTLGVMAADFTWPVPEETRLYNGAFGEGMKFRPFDKAMTQQNPPDFSWPRAVDYTNVKYHLIISDKEDMSNIVYEVKDLDINIYNFPHTFEKKTYYWQVSYTCDEGKSEWSDVRRFTIREDAVDFVVPADLSEVVKKINMQHPRLFNIEKVKEISKYRKDTYNAIRNTVNDAIAAGVQPEPTSFDDGIDQDIRTLLSKVYTVPFKCALVYQVDGNIEAAKHGVKQLVALCDWDAEQGLSSYQSQDQCDREIMYLSAIAYDYLYDFISDEEKEKIKDMIYKRMSHWAYYAFDNQGILYTPYNSHAYTAFGFVGVTCIGLFEDERFQELFERVLKIFINVSSPWIDEDGSHFWGTGYARYTNYMFLDALKYANIIDLYQKPGFRNRENWFLYMFLQDQDGGAFGDQSDDVGGGYSQVDLAKVIMHTGSGVAQYLYNVSPYTLSTPVEDWIVTYNPDIPEIAPTFKPRAKLFKDNGFVGMHSDLIDKNRVSLLFRSSQFGSDNHAHSDQNSFIIKAYGKELAHDSGYMDYYFSEFDAGYTRKTYSQNAITYDGGKGQEENNIAASGKITSFANGPDFDAVSGDATKSYMGGLDKAVRHMIYIRPDIFICIDDLKAKEGTQSNFEWWLNAKYDIYAYDTKDGARIVNEPAALDMKIQYPKNITMGYSDKFTGMDYSEEYTPTRTYANKPVHKRVWFQTEKVDKTKIITTMDVHKTDKPADYVKKTEYENYLELRFQDGSIAYVPTGDETHIVTEKYEFDAAALVVKGDGFILVDGTSFKENEKVIIKSEKPLTVTYSDYELNFTFIDDNDLEVTLPGMHTIKDKNQNEVVFGEKREEMTVTKTDDTFKFTGFGNSYQYYFNNKVSAGYKINDKTVNVYANGTGYSANMNGYIDHDGIYRYNGALPEGVPGGFYTVTALDKGINLDDSKAGDLIYITKGQKFSSSGDAKNVYLTSLYNAPVEIYDNQFNKDNVIGFIEAEDFTTLGSGQIYTSRSFMSGAAGVTAFNTAESKSTWKFKVTEAGNYDLVFEYVAFDDSKTYSDIERIITLNGNKVAAKIPFTVSFGSKPTDWREAKVNLGVWLEPGEYDLEIMASYGQWNIDWLGLVKR